MPTELSVKSIAEAVLKDEDERVPERWRQRAAWLICELVDYWQAFGARRG